jgi:hypothetical protein
VFRVCNSRKGYFEKLGGIVKTILLSFFAPMSSIPKSLVTACIFLVLAGTASINAASQGFMEGHLKIVSIKAVEPSDNMPRPAVPPETYAQYPLIILSQEEKKEIARVTADENGNYRVALPPGAYILDVQERAAKRIHAKPQPFTVVSNQTVRVDLGIFIGFR